jgi:hypothetical protein
MDWLFRHFPCMKFATCFFFSSLGENLHKFAQFSLQIFEKFLEMWLYITTIYLIFWESQLWILRTTLITAGGPLFLFLITIQHSNIIYIIDLLKNLFFLVSYILHFLQDLFWVLNACFKIQRIFLFFREFQFKYNLFSIGLTILRLYREQAKY